MYIYLLVYIILIIQSCTCSSDPSHSIQFQITFLQLLVMLAADSEIMKNKVIPPTCVIIIIIIIIIRIHVYLI